MFKFQTSLQDQVRIRSFCCFGWLLLFLFNTSVSIKNPRYVSPLVSVLFLVHSPLSFVLYGTFLLVGAELFALSSFVLNSLLIFKYQGVVIAVTEQEAEQGMQGPCGKVYFHIHSLTFNSLIVLFLR